MAYQALYRRLRPQTFDGVIGQQHIVKTLKNQIANNRISHAYLFCGTRGTGKTSTAKIFARAINCTSEGEKPCNECEVCRDILGGRSVNVVELDAASNNGVDNIREIIEEVKYPPTSGKYRVYIIDEVHMLSLSAFNALLKTIEEPPPHVVFILATTDPQKLPVTVLSRCQRFDFHRITLKDMTAVMSDFVREEGVDADEEALSCIAELSDGAMRDALSILDMCMSFYYGEKVTAEKVREITGASDKSAFFALTDAIISGDCAAALDITEKLAANGRDIQQFIGEAVMHFRNLLVARTVDGTCAALDYSQSYIDKLKEQAARLEYAYLLELIDIFSQLQNAAKYTQSPRIMLEVACIKACTPLTSASNAALEKRLISVEERLEKGVPAAAVQPAPAREEPKPVKIVEKAIPDDIKTLLNNWDAFLGIIEDPVVRTVFSNQIQPAYLEDDFLTFVCDHPSDVSTINRKRNEIKNYLREFSEKDFEIKAMMHEDYDKRHKEKYGAKDESILSIEESLKKLGYDIEIK